MSPTFRSLGQSRDTLKTLTVVATAANAEKLLNKKDVCETAISLIAMVEERDMGEQLYLDLGEAQIFRYFID
jgi:ATP phosphoribosyltransferase regulatory subunit HisZ